MGATALGTLARNEALADLTKLLKGEDATSPRWEVIPTSVRQKTLRPRSDDRVTDHFGDETILFA